MTTVSHEAICCWYGTSNEKAVLACECFSVYGQQSMSPSWILNAYQRQSPARSQKAVQVAAVLCSIRLQRFTEPLTSILNNYQYRALCVSLHCHFSSLHPPTDSIEWNHVSHGLLLIRHHRLLARTKSNLYRNQRNIKRASQCTPSLKIELKYKLRWLNMWTQTVLIFIKNYGWPLPLTKRRETMK